MYRASTDDATGERDAEDDDAKDGRESADAVLNAHRSVYASRNEPPAPPSTPSPPPSSATRVPPLTGPARGAAPLAESGAW